VRLAIDARPARWYRGTGIGEYTVQCLRALADGEYTVQCLRALADYAWETELMAVWPDADTDAEDLPPAWRGRVCVVPRRAAREEECIADWLWRSGADVYHVPQNGLRAPLPCPVPLVITVHDLIPYVLPETVRRGFQKKFLRTLPAVVREAAQIVTVSQTSARDLERILGVPSERVSVVYPAPGPEFRPQDRPAAAARMAKRYGVRERYVAYAGGLNPRKNVAELVSAFAKVCRRLSPARLLVVAGVPSRLGPDLEGLARALGVKDYVRFPGVIEPGDMPLFYAAADVLVYPSLYEGFGLPPLEAMACGTPVVAAASPALPEVLGDAALLVDPEDTLALARAIEQVCRDEETRLRLVDAGRRQARSYDWRLAGAELMRVYRRAASRRRGWAAAQGFIGDRAQPAGWPQE